MIRDIFATILSLAVIVGVLWGLVWGFLFSVEIVASWGVPEELLYFAGGMGFAANYKKFWNWYFKFAEDVWVKIHEWLVWG